MGYSNFGNALITNKSYFDQNAKIETLVEPIRTGLRNIMSEFLKKQPPEEAALLAWPVVCGAEVAARTKAVSFADGRLTIEVQDTAWGAQLAAFTPRYLSALNELLGELVKEVRFQVKGAFPPKS